VFDQCYGVTSIAGSVLLILGTVLYFKFVNKKPLKVMGFGFNRRDIGFSVAAILLMPSSLIAYMTLLSSQGLVSADFNGSLFSDLQVIPLFLMIVFAWILAAFSEELLYRGYMVSMLKHLTTGRLFAVTSLFFMLSHVFKGMSPVYSLFLVIGAVTLLYVYLKSGSVLTVTIVHALYNLTTTHLIGKSDIAIVQLHQDPELQYLFIADLLVYTVLFLLTAVFYRNNRIRKSHSRGSIHA
jgi:membrane protease YdiL (CAAX protease family)